MQTLISVFDDRANARKAVEKLIRTGFAQEDVQLKESTEGEAPAETSGDRGVLDSIGHFFVSLFGEDRGEATAGAYRKSMARGHSVVVVDARTDEEAEVAAVVLHEAGAVDVEDRESSGGTATQPGVRAYQREAQPSLRELAHSRQLRQDSLLADRAGQVSKEMKEDREERAYAAAMPITTRDRPK